MAILATPPRNRNASQYLTTSEAAAMVGCSYMTITRAMESGDIEGIKTSGGHRRVEVKSVCEFFGLPLPSGYECRETESTGKVIAGYCRVSTSKQVEAGNLKRQIERVSAFIAENYAGREMKIFSEQGSGLNNDRPQLSKLIDFILSGRVEVLVVEYGDRLSRSARSLIVSLCQKCGCEVVETKQGEKESNAQTEQEEMVYDMLAITTCFSAKVNGRRGGAKTRFVAAPELKTRIAALYAEGKSVNQICKTVIQEGHKCCNTGKTVGKWSVWKLIDAVKAELRSTDASREPESVKKFVKQYCKVSRAAKVYGAAFYQTYAAFCKREGYEVLNNQTLAETLRGMGYEHKREDAGCSVVYGLALKHNRRASTHRKGWKVILPAMPGK